MTIWQRATLRSAPLGLGLTLVIGCASDGAIAAAAARHLAPIATATAPGARPAEEMAVPSPLLVASGPPLPGAVLRATPTPLPERVMASATPALPETVITTPLAPLPPPSMVTIPAPARTTVSVAVDRLPIPALQPAPTSPPTLDMAGLTSRLRETRAIGVFTKLALKNQVDDLMAQFRQHYAGDMAATPVALREPYNLLVLKVLSLIQDDDPELARQLSGSREAIWGILADRQAFQAAA